MPFLTHLLTGSALGWIAWLPLANADQPLQATEPALDQLVTAYFSSEQPDRRAELVQAIRRRSADDWSAVARVLPDLKLWLPESNRTGVFLTEDDGRGPIGIWFELPDGYDATKTHPVILCIAGPSQSPADCIRDGRSRLGPGAEGFIFVGSNRIIAPSFHQSSIGADRTLDVVRAIRRRFHTDTDRLLAYGSDEGADAAWMVTITHPELFAGFISIDGYLNAPYPDEMYRLWLPNLRGVRGLVAFHAVGEPIHKTRAGRVVVHNRAIVAVAHDLSLPLDVGAFGLTGAAESLDDDRLASILSSRRSRDGAETSHCFRYPWQGRAGWLRQARFGGEVWTAEQLSIRASSSGDASDFTSGVLRDHLAFVGGRVEGQEIGIEARRCREIEVRIAPETVDLDKPVTIRCNGKRRHHGLISRSIETLLTCAREDWEFQRPVAATVRISIQSDTE